MSMRVSLLPMNGVRGAFWTRARGSGFQLYDALVVVMTFSFARDYDVTLCGGFGWVSAMKVGDSAGFKLWL